jgi:hypothetical protein
MVRLAGLEPARGLFAWFLIVTFCCIYLQVLIHQFTCDCNGFCALMGNNEQKKLCGVVRASAVVRSCAVNEICAGFVRGGFVGIASFVLPAVKIAWNSASVSRTGAGDGQTRPALGCDQEVSGCPWLPASATGSRPGDGTINQGISFSARPSPPPHPPPPPGTRPRFGRSPFEANRDFGTSWRTNTTPIGICCRWNSAP